MASWWIVVASLATLATARDDPASLQLQQYKNYTNGTVFPLTTTAGRPVSYKDSNDVLNTNIIHNEFFLDSMSHILASNIPDRIVHAKGAGAFGYFEVTQNFTQFSKAKLFDSIGKRTPIAVRIGPGTGFKGGADLERTLRGMAIKFYTEEGNWDVPAMAMPMFFFKDPLIFPSFNHAFRPNPVTFLQDFNAKWDALTLRPETLFAFMYINSYKGISDGFRNLDAFSVHTLQLENANDELYFARFHFIPENGTKYLNNADAATLDSDYGVRDLYNSIAEGNYPAWIVYAQLITHEQIKTDGAKLIDITRIIPVDEYPLTEIGRLVLNKNPTNYFAQVEQMAFCPSNLVPGISGGPDKMYEARRLAYRLARNHRLGINANNIPINQPLTPSINYLRDGVAPINPTNFGPNYYPNSYNGPVPLGTQSPKLIEIEEDASINNYDQANDFYTSMTTDQQAELVNNIVATLSQAQTYLQERAVEKFAEINTTLSASIEMALVDLAASC